MSEKIPISNHGPPEVRSPLRLDALGSIESMKAEPSETARKIDIAQIQGQVHAQSVQKVGELADKSPSEAVSIIRQWMSESNAA